MSSSLREKIALFVFLGLIVVSLGALIWYLTMGHSWNIAASTIDDATGQMDGYTAILYEGTVEPKPDSSSNNSTDKVSPRSSLPDSTPNDRNSLSEPDELMDESEKDSGKSDNDPNGGLSSGTTSSRLITKKPITLEDVEEKYLEKNATVFSLDAADTIRYREGMILKKGNDRFGVFSVTALDSTLHITSLVSYFTKHEVDFIVVITSEKSIVEKISGIDIVITTADEKASPVGETSGGAFYINTPEKGSIGAILVSPHNVVSAKVIQEL